MPIIDSIKAQYKNYEHINILQLAINENNQILFVRQASSKEERDEWLSINKLQEDKDLQNITTIDIMASSPMCEETELKKLITYLSEMPTIRQLNYTFNFIGNAWATIDSLTNSAKIFKAIAHAVKVLDYLKLHTTCMSTSLTIYNRGTSVNESMMDKFWIELIDQFKDLVNIKFISIVGTAFNFQMNDKSLKYFVNNFYLSNSSTLKNIVLKNHDFTSKSLNNLFAAINAIGKVEFLDLAYSLSYSYSEREDREEKCFMSKEDIIAVCKGLLKNNTLRFVKFNNGDYLIPFDLKIIEALSKLVNQNTLLELKLPKFDQEDHVAIKTIKEHLTEQWQKNRLQSEDVLEIIPELLVEQEIVNVLDIFFAIKDKKIRGLAELEIANFLLNLKNEFESPEQKQARIINAMSWLSNLFVSEDVIYLPFKKAFAELLKNNSVGLSSNIGWQAVFALNPVKAEEISEKIRAINNSEHNGKRNVAIFLLNKEAVKSQKAPNVITKYFAPSGSKKRKFDELLPSTQEEEVTVSSTASSTQLQSKLV